MERVCTEASVGHVVQLAQADCEPVGAADVMIWLVWAVVLGWYGRW